MAGRSANAAQRHKRQKRYVEPRVYEIGVDVPQALIDDLQIKLTDWIAETRTSVKEPGTYVRRKIKDCLEGKTADGKPWFQAANSTFETRIKMACNFDVATMSGNRSPDQKNKVRKERERQREAKKKLEAREDANIPDEIRAELRHSAKYGDNASVFLSSAEAERHASLKAEYQKQFPELREINAAAELDALCDLLVLQERMRFKLLKGEKVDPLDSKGIIDQMTTLKKALGIHPEQLAKRAKDSAGGSVSEVIARLEAMPNAKEIREKYFVEELLQAYQMYMTPSPRADMGGYQLDDIGLFGMTRCRTCHCPRCGTLNYAGLAIEEIEQYLVNKGVLELGAMENPVQQYIDGASEAVDDSLLPEDDSNVF